VQEIQAWPSAAATFIFMNPHGTLGESVTPVSAVAALVLGSNTYRPAAFEFTDIVGYVNVWFVPEVSR
jgi:hypothetical protein